MFYLQVLNIDKILILIYLHCYVNFSRGNNVKNLAVEPGIESGSLACRAIALLLSYLTTQTHDAISPMLMGVYSYN